MNWDEVANHTYLTLDKVDTIPLNILYDDESNNGETSTYRNEYLIINTKNPTKFERYYQEATQKMMNKFEDQIIAQEEKLSGGMNERGLGFEDPAGDNTSYIQPSDLEQKAMKMSDDENK